MSSTEINPPTIKYSPWGGVQQQYKEGTGVYFVGTASHGGFKLSPGKNKLIPEIFRNENCWYEEDCEASIVVYFLAGHIRHWKEKKESARKTILVWYWEAWEAYTGETVDPKDSSQKRQHLWEEINKDKFTVDSALSLGNGMVGVSATRKSDGAKAWFKVPKEEYTIPFAVDESRHERSETRLF